MDTDLILFVSEETVWSYYKHEFDLSYQGKKILVWVGPSGEKIKDFFHFQSCIEFFLEKGIHRKAHLVAIGGGALSDFAGFVASTLLRGISWSVIPTTLLSMVDAAIGGKVAINTLAGKNLLGAFHLPLNLWLNLEFLKTLPLEEHQCGKGEILKYAFLDKEIFMTLKGKGDLSTLVPLCIKYKRELVEEDLKENGRRMFLNFGHTFGHAFEKIFMIGHGEAVILGIEFILVNFIKNEKLLKIFQELKETLGIPKNYQLSYYWPKIDKVAFLSYIFKDKKIKNLETMRLILLKDIGNPFVCEVTQTEISKQVMGFE